MQCVGESGVVDCEHVILVSPPHLASHADAEEVDQVQGSSTIITQLKIKQNWITGNMILVLEHHVVEPRVTMSKSHKLEIFLVLDFVGLGSEALFTVSGDSLQQFTVVMARVLGVKNLEESSVVVIGYFL